jgi:DNA-binding MarR family transcriptional regulator
MKVGRAPSLAKKSGRKARANKSSVDAKPTNRADAISSNGVVWSNDSIASKLLTTANVWRRGGNAYYRRRFGISITDVRILTLLEVRAPLSLNAIASHCGTDKTQMSRAVKELVRRKFLHHNRSSRDPSKRGLSLDVGGERMCRRLSSATEGRLAMLVASLSEGEVRTLDAALDTLLRNARRAAEAVAGRQV